MCLFKKHVEKKILWNKFLVSKTFASAQARRDTKTFTDLGIVPGTGHL